MQQAKRAASKYPKQITERYWQSEEYSNIEKTEKRAFEGVLFFEKIFENFKYFTGYCRKSFLRQFALDKKALVHFYQINPDCRNYVKKKDEYVKKVIHIQKTAKSTKNDLYTDLCTISTGFLCKSQWFVMVTLGTFVLYSSNKNANSQKRCRK